MSHLRWLLLVATLAALGGIGYWVVGENPQNRDSIRVGTSPWPGYEYIHLADKKGYFREENVPIQLIRYGSLEDTRRAYERLQVDGMATTLVELLQAAENGAPAKIVMITDFSEGADAILARKGIASVADLKGKTVGIEPGSLSAFIIARALENAGLRFEDVKTVGMSPLDMKQALLSGSVDALHVYPPLSLEISKFEDQVVKIFDTTSIPREVLDIVSFNPNIVENRRQDIAAFHRAIEKAHVFARQNPNEAYKIMAEFENITSQEFAEALKGIKILNYAEQDAVLKDPQMKQTIARAAAILKSTGDIKTDFDPTIFLITSEAQD